MVDQSEKQIDQVVHGLKSLYQKLSTQGKAHAAKTEQESDQQKREKPFDMKGMFDQDSDACLNALQELFLTRVN